MNWESVARVISAGLSTAVPLLIKAFVNGDSDAYKRVKDIIPDEMESEALLAHETARLAEIDARDGNADG